MKSFFAKADPLADAQSTLPMAPKVLAQVPQELAVRQEPHGSILRDGLVLTSAKQSPSGSDVQGRGLASNAYRASLRAGMPARRSAGLQPAEIQELNMALKRV